MCGGAPGEYVQSHKEVRDDIVAYIEKTSMDTGNQEEDAFTDYSSEFQ